MALTLLIVKGDLGIAISETGNDEKLKRLIVVAEERVQAEAPGSPMAQRDLAATLFLSFLFHYGAHRGGVNLPSAWQRSGAAAIVRPWRKIRAGRIESKGI